MLSEISTNEKLAYLPFYGIAGGWAFILIKCFFSAMAFFKMAKRSWTYKVSSFFLNFFFR